MRTRPVRRAEHALLVSTLRAALDGSVLGLAILLFLLRFDPTGLAGLVAASATPETTKLGLALAFATIFASLVGVVHVLMAREPRAR